MHIGIAFKNNIALVDSCKQKPDSPALVTDCQLQPAIIKYHISSAQVIIMGFQNTLRNRSSFIKEGTMFLLLKYECIISRLHRSKTE